MAVETLELPIRGMTCGNCARAIRRKLSGAPGVANAQVELQSERAIVEYDPAQTDREKLAGAVRQLGYEVPGA